VFSSEKYGDGFAAHLTAVFNRHVTHEIVDLQRTTVPISGTQLRNDRLLWERFVDTVVHHG